MILSVGLITPFPSQKLEGNDVLTAVMHRNHAMLALSLMLHHNAHSSLHVTLFHANSLFSGCCLTLGIVFLFTLDQHFVVAQYAHMHKKLQSYCRTTSSNPELHFVCYKSAPKQHLC